MNYYGTLLFNKSVYLIHQCIFPGNWQSELLRLCWLTLRWFWILSPTLQPFFVTCHALQYFLPVMSNCSSLNSIANKHSNDLTFVSLNRTLRYIRPKVSHRFLLLFNHRNYYYRSTLRAHAPHSTFEEAFSFRFFYFLMSRKLLSRVVTLIMSY